jgi:hypothetical protein
MVIHQFSSAFLKLLKKGALAHPLIDLYHITRWVQTINLMHASHRISARIANLNPRIFKP